MIYTYKCHACGTVWKRMLVSINTRRPVFSNRPVPRRLRCPSCRGVGHLVLRRVRP